MGAVKGYWQHANGKIYAVKSDTFGKISGGVGPLDPDDLHGLDEYEYNAAIIDWLQDAVARHQLRRINP